MSTYQNATDAEIVVDDQFTFESSTNTFADAIDGLTLTAKKVNTSGVSVEVSSDVDAQAAKIQSFVDAYNNAISAGHLASGWGGIKASNSYLAGDSAVRGSLDLLSRTVAGSISGLTGKYKQLAAVGVSLTQDGSIKLDKSKLKTALAADAKSVAQVFVGDPDADVDGAMRLVTAAVERITKSKDGILSLRIGQFDKELTRLEDDAETLERRLESFEATLRKRFAALEDAVSKIQYQSRGLSGFTRNTTK
jgi:flagellar hook-associated protein 2